MSSAIKKLFPPAVIDQVLQDLAIKKEIPDWIGYYNFEVGKFINNDLEPKMVPSKHNQVLYKEKALLCNHGEFINRHLYNFDKINLFDLLETTGTSSLPFTLSLLEEKRLGKYVPITVASYLNQEAVNRLSIFALEAHLPKLESNQIINNFEVRSCKTEIKGILGDFSAQKKASTNLFLLMNSYLGNSLNPKKLLKNIYDSMMECDHLVVLQGIYRSGSEDLLLSDYQSLVDNPDTYLGNKSLAKALNPDYDLKVYWSDSKSPGIRIDLKLGNSTDFGSVKLEEESVITLFRSVRFLEGELRNIFREVGFKIIEISYDQNMDTALFYLER